MRIGLKIWSINNKSFQKLAELHKDKHIDYVELYIVPDSFDPKKLRPLKQVPIIFHAPNFHHKFNLCTRNDIFNNALKTIRQFVDFFNESRIIFHPGLAIGNEDEDIRNTISNIAFLKNKFDIILENVPGLGFDRKLKLIAANPSKIRKILDATGVKFCLDFGHAIVSANYYNEKPIKFIEEFLSFAPFMFHLSDGDFKGAVDKHLSFGEGDFPLKSIVKMLPEEGYLSLETPKCDFETLKEDHKNLIALKKLLQERE